MPAEKEFGDRALMSEKSDGKSESTLPVVPAGGLAFERFDEDKLLAFYERSNSVHTRRAYVRVVREFFNHFKWRHPRTITSKQIIEWRDQLLANRQKPATVILKLSIVRSVDSGLCRWKNTSGFTPPATRSVPKRWLYC